MVPMASPAGKERMRISAPGCSRKHSFTLVEVLVVLVLMAIMLGLASANFAQNPRRQMNKEGQQLAMLLQICQIQAMASGHSIGVTMSDGYYRFWQPGPDNTWVPLEHIDQLEDRRIDDRVQVLEITVNQERLPPPGRLIFTSSGINLPYSVTLELDNERVQIASNGINAAEIEGAKQ